MDLNHRPADYEFTAGESRRTWVDGDGLRWTFSLMISSVVVHPGAPSFACVQRRGCQKVCQRFAAAPVVHDVCLELTPANSRAHSCGIASSVLSMSWPIGLCVAPRTIFLTPWVNRLGFGSPGYF